MLPNCADFEFRAVKWWFQIIQTSFFINLLIKTHECIAVYWLIHLLFSDQPLAFDRIVFKRATSRNPFKLHHAHSNPTLNESNRKTAHIVANIQLINIVWLCSWNYWKNRYVNRFRNNSIVEIIPRRQQNDWAKFLHQQNIAERVTIVSRLVYLYGCQFTATHSELSDRT